MVEEVFYDVSTGESGRRLVEMPDVISESEATSREPEMRRQLLIEDLKPRVQRLLIEQALGIDVSAQLQQMRQAYLALTG